MLKSRKRKTNSRLRYNQEHQPRQVCLRWTWGGGGRGSRSDHQLGGVRIVWVHGFKKEVSYLAQVGSSAGIPSAHSRISSLSHCLVSCEEGFLRYCSKEGILKGKKWDCGGCLHPWFMARPSTETTTYSSTIVHCVQSLYINLYVCSNKLVLS